MFVVVKSSLCPGEVYSSMASDAFPPGDDALKARKRKRMDVQAVDIEEFISAGHRALQEGRTDDALNCFHDALKAAGQVRRSGSEVTDR